MVFFSFVEVVQRQYLYYYGLRILGSQLCDGFLDKSFFGLVSIVDSCAVLRSLVVPLFV